MYLVFNEKLHCMKKGVEKMKKQFGILIAGVMLIAGLAGCSSATSDNAGSNTRCV